MKAQLHISFGTESRVVELPEGQHAIGRDPQMSIQIDEQDVSRHHADLVVEKNRAWIRDLGSANGTWVKGERIRERELFNGDRITIGNVSLEFRSDSSSISTRRDLAPSTAKPTSLRSSVGLIILFLSGSVTGLGAYSYRSLLLNRLQDEVVIRAGLLTRFLAEKNREDLKMGNELLLDIDSTLKEPGVKAAFIIDRKGQILAPISKLHQSQQDPFVMDALEGNGDRVLTPRRTPEGDYIFVHPIRAYDDKVGRYETLGVTKLIFSPSRAMGTLHDLDRLTLMLGVLCITLSLLATWFLIRRLTSPLLRLSEQIQRWRVGEKVSKENPPFTEWKPLYDAWDQMTEDSSR